MQRLAKLSRRYLKIFKKGFAGKKLRPIFAVRFEKSFFEKQKSAMCGLKNNKALCRANSLQACEASL